MRKLELAKTNRGAAGQTKLLRWQEGRCVVENREWNDIEKQLGDEMLFMKLLSQFTCEGRNVTAKKGPSYAPKEFSENVEGKRISDKRFKHAMDNLLSVNKIRMVEEGPDSRRRSKLVIVS